MTILEDVLWPVSANHDQGEDTVNVGSLFLHAHSIITGNNAVRQ